MFNKSFYILIVFLLLFLTCSYGQEGKKVILLTTKSEEALKYYKKALLAINQLYLKEAVENFKKAIETDPEFVMARSYYAIYLESPENQNMINEAKRSFAKVTEGEQMFTLAMEARINNDLAKSIEIFEELSAKYPEDSLVYYQLLILYKREKLYEKAIEAGKKAIACDPNIYGAYNSLGYRYLQIGKFDEAIKWLNKYAEFLPKSANPLDSLADAYRHAGKYKEAWKCYQKALEIKPDFTPSLINLGDIKHELGYYEEAVPYYMEGLKSLLPQKEISESRYRAVDAAWRVRLLNNFLYMGEVEKADKMITEEFFYAEEIESSESQEQEEVDRILQHDSMLGNIFGHYISAEIALRKGDIPRAKKETELVQKLEKEYGFIEEEKDQIVNFLRAKIALAEDDLDMAEKLSLAAVYAFEKEGQSNILTRIYPLGNDRKICVEPLNLLVEIRRKQGKVSDEIQVIKKSLELIPHQPKLHYRLGEIYAQLNNQEKATESFHKYLEFCEYFNCSEEAKEKAKQFITKY